MVAFLEPSQKRRLFRGLWTLGLGLFLGGLLTKLAESFLPESAARSFLTAAVRSSFGPVPLDLVAVAFSLGPVEIALNVLSLVGIAVVALIVRSWM